MGWRATAIRSFPDTNGRVRRILAELPDSTDVMLPAACYTDPDFCTFEQRAVFARIRLCVGRVEQVAEPGDCLQASPAGEPIVIVRDETGQVRAFSAVCQRRGAILSCESGHRHLRCPLHFWSYELSGGLVGAPRTSAAELRDLRQTVRLPEVRLELGFGFILVNLDGQTPPLAPSVAKVEPFWAGHQAADLVAVPPEPADTPLPWNWKVHVENFTAAYHPEFVHRGTHDFGPNVHPAARVRFTPMQAGDNAILRTVPLCCNRTAA